MRNRPRIAASIALGIVLAVGALAAPPASAALTPTIVQCGVPIVSSIRAMNNLDCPNSGIVVGADGITIDLAGHRIEGDQSVGGYGVDNSGGFNEVTVKNGTIDHFEFGVVLTNTDRNIMKDLIVTDSKLNGFGLSTTTRAVLLRNDSLGNGAHGIALAPAGGSTLSENNVSHNAESGIFISSSSGPNTVKNNAVNGNGESGIAVTGSSGGQTISGNRVASNERQGIYITGNASTISGNKVIDNDWNGIELASADSNTVRGNRVRSSGGENVLFQVTGIALANASGNVVTGNDVRSSFYSAFALQFSSLNNKLANNVGAANNRSGLFVDAGSTGNVINVNVFSENGLHGIDSEATQITISKNRAERNGFFNGATGGGIDNDADDDVGLGILAEASTSGGDNVAKGNRDPDQCVPASLC